MTNRLYYGDNLTILRDNVADESVDLIYLDPPFNSKATYNVLFKSPAGQRSEAQLEAFEDTWHWTEEAEKAFDEVMQSGNTDVAEMIRSMRVFLSENDMMAYLTMMAVRLLELHQKLKDTGNLFLHCDPTASHYLKVLLDAVFHPANFKNEVIWRRTGANKSTNRYGPIHQTLLFYGKTSKAFFEPAHARYTQEYVDTYFINTDDRGIYQAVLLTGPGTRTGDSGKPWRGFDPTTVGRHWQPASYLYAKYQELTGDNLANYPLIERLDELDKVGLIHWGKRAGSQARYKYYVDDAPGVAYQDIWAYQPGTRGCIYEDKTVGIDEDVRWLMSMDAERLGFPTQKPVGLIERIINTACPEDGIVMDPFCGCGTTIHAAQRLKRSWIGIDITHLAISLIEKRLKDAFPDIQYEVHGTPKTLAAAKKLADQDKFQFEWWAVSLVDAQPYKGKKKGADSGIDGILYFKTAKNKTERAIVSVKGGKNIGVAMIRDLKAVVEREKAEIGLFICLAEPTKPMVKEAVSGKFYDSKGFGKFSKIQILTIEEILKGKKPDIPNVDKQEGFKQAKLDTQASEQHQFDI